MYKNLNNGCKKICNVFVFGFEIEMSTTKAEYLLDAEYFDHKKDDIVEDSEF